MRVGTVAATVVSTISHPSLEGKTLLLVDYEGPDGAPTGAYTIAVDTVGAGIGEQVLVLDEGSSARQILQEEDAPIRAVVVATVDAMNRQDPTV
jgi:microcompartment protein CcmK/EutM